MFAVPGWSLSAPLKTQTDPLPASAAPADGEAAAPPQGKKRKRKSKAPEKPAISSENLAEAWEKVIEKKQPSTTGTDAAGERAKKKRRKSKGDKEGDAVVKDAAGGETTESQQNPQTKKRNEKKKQKKEEQKKKQAEEDLAVKPAVDTKPAAAPSLPNPDALLPPAPPKLTPLQASMRAKLASARFRHLNQTLYTTPSKSALELFEENPEMFDDYHTGFRQQVEVWPQNPVDTYIATVLSRGKIREEARGGKWRGQKGKKENAQTNPNMAEVGAKDTSVRPLPRDRNGVCRFADLGCGDAKFSKALQPHLNKLKLRVLSFDLAAPSELVTKADISNLPLKDGEADVAIFCLALMGTNWLDFIDEAYRILRWKGELWVAEIKSRFGRAGGANSKKSGQGRVEHSVGFRQKKGAAPQKKGKKGATDEDAVDDNDDEALAVEVDGADDDRTRKREETDVSAFVEALRRRGFVLDPPPVDGRPTTAIDLSNKMFVKMQFIKAATPVRGKNAKAAEERKGAAGQTWKAKPKAGFVEADEITEEDEAKILKPCVYKLR